MKLTLILIPLLFLSSCTIDGIGIVSISNEITRGIISLITTLIGIYIGFYLWKKQEKIKRATESGTNLLVALKKYEISIEQARPIGFILNDTEENIRTQHWENVIKSWKELTSSYTIACTTIKGLKKLIALDGILELQNELYANLSTYLARQNKDDNSDKEIAKVIRRNIDKTKDDFAIQLSNKIEEISQIVESNKSINL